MAIHRTKAASRIALLVVSISGLLALAACGGSSSNGESAKAPDKIFSDAQAATTGATSVHISGTGSASGSSFSLDIVDGPGKGGGTIGITGANLQLVLSQQNVYVKADQASWTKLGSGSSAAALLAGKWLQTTTSNQDFSQIASFLDISKLVPQIKPTGTITKQKTTTFDGQSAIPLTDSSNDGTLYVAAKGKPYILGVKGGGGDKGTLTFDEYNKGNIPAPPSGAVSLSQLQNGG